MDASRIVGFEFVATAALLVVGVVLLVGPGAGPWLALERGFRTVATRRGLAVVVTAVCSLAINATVALRHGAPLPQAPDEFGHLLAADTFDRGRLTNPPHPLWRHFQSQGVIQQPTYQSKHPPGDAMFLALGRAIGGPESLGVWLGLAVACGALCWMLREWVGPVWALVGGLLVAACPTVVHGWGQTFLGGGVAMLGGSLVFGAARRVVTRPRASDAVLLAVGLLLLANSRPFEGLLAGALAAGVLVWWVVRVPRPGPRDVVLRVGVPMTLVLAVGAGWMAYYNHRVTGDALVLPYQVWYRTYLGGTGIVDEFVLNRPTARRQPTESIPGMFASPDKRVEDADLRERLARKRIRMIAFNAGFYLPGVLAIGLAGLPRALRERWIAFALGGFLAVQVAVLYGNTMFAPHYSAPVAPLAFAVLVSSVRAAYGWTSRSRPIGRWFARALALAFVVVSLHGLYLHEPDGAATSWGRSRQAIVNSLEAMPGRHLVLVRYERGRHVNHQWVQNEADIDAARVVWAHALGDRKDSRLRTYFHDRTVWELDATHSPPRLSRLSGVVTGLPPGDESGDGDLLERSRP